MMPIEPCRKMRVRVPAIPEKGNGPAWYRRPAGQLPLLISISSSTSARDTRPTQPLCSRRGNLRSGRTTRGVDARRAGPGGNAPPSSSRCSDTRRGLHIGGISVALLVHASCGPDAIDRRCRSHGSCNRITHTRPGEEGSGRDGARQTSHRGLACYRSLACRQRQAEQRSIRRSRLSVSTALET